MKVAYIVCENYLTPDGNGMSVGGIQTYLTNLIPVLQGDGYEIHLYQKGSIDFEKRDNNVLITGIAHDGTKKEYIKSLKGIVLNKMDSSEDLLVFGCDTLIFESRDVKSIAIQHGINNIVKILKLKQVHGLGTILRSSEKLGLIHLD